MVVCAQLTGLEKCGRRAPKHKREYMMRLYERVHGTFEAALADVKRDVLLRNQRRGAAIVNVFKRRFFSRGRAFLRVARKRDKSSAEAKRARHQKRQRVEKEWAMLRARRKQRAMKKGYK